MISLKNKLLIFYLQLLKWTKNLKIMNESIFFVQSETFASVFKKNIIYVKLLIVT